uniref:CSON013098 protein n=1 Tax=Culicoides sonorensis TaxID=179676 RepID=A0A336KXR8_CULSO
MESQMFLHYQKDSALIVPWINRFCAVFWENSFHRGQILEILGNGMYNVRFIDYGITVHTSYDNLRKLSGAFITEPSAAYCCALKDVLVKNKTDLEVWPKEACKFLQTLLLDTNDKFKVIIHNNRIDLYEITLINIGKDISYCVNGQLVAAGLADSDGPESCSSIYKPKSEEYEEKSSQEPVSKEIYFNQSQTVFKHKRYGDYCEIVYVNTPSEFYVTLTKDLESTKRFQDAIQDFMDDSQNELKRGSTAISALDNGNCLVNVELDGKTHYKTWCRGVIKEGKDKMYIVRLRDRGETINVHYDDIAEIPDQFFKISDNVIKCSLACIKPTGGQSKWTQTAIELFKSQLKQYQKYCVRLHGSLNEFGDAIPVILFGMRTKIAHPLSPSIQEWFRINEDLAMNGVALATERFEDLSSISLSESETENDIRENIITGFNISDTIEKTKSPDEDENLFFDTTPKEIDAWLPAPPIIKSMFSCTPTYVDDDAVIYIQDNQHIRQLDSLKQVIKQYIKSKKGGEFRKLPHVIKDKPCLVRYHLDNEFYRAKLIRYIPRSNTYEVQFVDYGNIDEEIKEEDICLEVIGHNQPLFVNKVRLIGISPNTKDGVWPKDVLDKLHQLVVEKVCQISIEDDDPEFDDVKLCRLTSYEFDCNIAQYLVDHDMAKYSADSFGEREQMHFRKQFTPNLQQFAKMEDYVNHFHNLSLNLLEQSFSTQSCDKETSPKEVFCISEGLNLSRFENLSDETFDPKHENTSSHFDASEKPVVVPKCISPTAFPPFNLKQLPDKFYATVLKVVTPRTMYIKPKIDLFKKEINQLERKLVHISKYKIPMKCKLEDVSPPMMCLAYYNERKIYARAMIESVDKKTKTAKVTLVDHVVELENIPLDELRRCPTELQKFPLFWIAVELNKITPNKHVRGLDLIRTMKKELDNRYVYCVVNRINTVDSEEAVGVDFYEDDSCKRLIYENLLKEKYFYIKNN